MSIPWKFYAAPMSYFSGKVRPALVYKKIEHTEIWPTREVQKEIITPKTGVRFIPVIETDGGEILQDSPRMLERIEELYPSPAIFPEDPAVRMVAEVIQDFCDDVLVPLALHYRWSFPEQRTWVEEDWAAVFGPIANKLAAQMAGALAFVGVTDKTRLTMEEWFLHFLELLNRHFAHSRYVLGDCITVADYAIHGPMFAHFARDPVPARIVRETAPNVMAWLHEVSAAGPPAPWAKPPEVRESLAPLLAEIGAVFVPAQIAVSSFVSEAIGNQPAGEEASRVIGIIEQSVFGIPEQRIASAYSVWRHRRTAQRYAALARAERGVVDEILGPAGVLPYLQTIPTARLTMDRFTLRIG
ncbi:MAG TPA: glutathione S-transferase family protein [Candidatus Limnocylindrales bacterium]|nr:glutathione S-transferase family protein [Candidatus Limnocylindrales bacterium]